MFYFGHPLFFMDLTYIKAVMLQLVRLVSVFIIFAGFIFSFSAAQAQHAMLGMSANEENLTGQKQTSERNSLAYALQNGYSQEGLRFMFGADVFRLQQSEITGFNAISMVYAFPGGFYLGNSVYSSAFGTGGGFFVGGIESGFWVPLHRQVQLQLGLFAGGGGGANQVGGDGLMLRSHAAVAIEFTEGWFFSPGVSYVAVSGSSISTAALNLGLTRRLDLALSGGYRERANQSERAFRIAAFKPVYRLYRTGNAEKRGIPGRPLDDMHTIGAEITFSNSPWYEVFIQTHGVVAGDAEGYADWLAGYRFFWNLRPFRLSASLGTGSAGGGAVNSGGGQVYMAGASLSLPAWRNVALELEAMTVRSVNGDFRTFAPGARLIRYMNDPFQGANDVSYRWAAQSGITLHIPNSGYRKYGDRRGPLVYMIEAALDLMLTEQLYITGRGYTSFIGDAGGYQIGLLGPGFVIALPNNLTLRAEVYIGAGGGATVDTRGGLLTGARAEVAVPVWRALQFTAGAGTLMPVLGRGMNPLTLHTGMRIPFRTYH